MEEEIQMKRLILAFCLCLASPAFADQTLPPSGSNVYTVVQKKEIFSIRHPLIHKYWRWTRRACQISLPVVQWAGAAAQIGTVFK